MIIITTSIEFNKQTFQLPYDTEFVFIVIAYERNSAGVEKKSGFSNRVMRKTPTKLDFTISIDRGDLDGK